ncbi:MAG: lactonase family protein [Clostridiales bacterium]|nr:lactonase family protein [Clostridiales bacterium]
MKLKIPVVKEWIHIKSGLGIEYCTAYIGTYTSEKSEGIYAIDLDSKTGKLKQKGVMAKLENPSYLTIDINNKYLYSVLETGTFEGEYGGGVAAFSIENRSGGLKLLNYQSTKGQSPCHISTNSLNSYLFAASYGDGTVTVFPINPDGSIGSLLSKTSRIFLRPNTGKQENPHAHFVTLTPQEKHLCAVDLGLDRIMVYEYDQKNGALTYSENLSVSVKPGSGPRHMEFHPGGEFAYLINEFGSDVVVLNYSPYNFRFMQIQEISTLPEGYTGTNFCAAIHVSPDGNFLYASNRGHDSIAVFKIHKISGKLTLVSHSTTLGKFPRDFAIDPTGKFLIAANQNSDTIVSFAIIEESGKLEPVDSIIDVPSPVCIKFACL